MPPAHKGQPVRGTPDERLDKAVGELSQSMISGSWNGEDTDDGREFGGQKAAHDEVLANVFQSCA